MYTNLDECRYIKDMPINWGDMDAFKHVNNVMYFKYFESARISYLETLDYSRIARELNISVILASINAKYISPLFYPDLIRVGIDITEVKADRFTMNYILFSTTQNKVAAVGSSVIVTYDYKENKKIEIPEDLRLKLL